MLTQIDEEVPGNGPLPATSRAQPPELTNQESAKLNVSFEGLLFSYSKNSSTSNMSAMLLKRLTS